MVITVASRTPASLRAQKAVPLPQRYARALRWASRHAAGAPDLGLLKAMGRLERSLRQG